MVCNVVSDAFAIPKDELLRKSRVGRARVEARQIAMALVREFSDLSTSRVAMIFGLSDHTTVIYASKQVRQREQADSDYAAIMADLREQIRAGMVA